MKYKKGSKKARSKKSLKSPGRIFVSFPMAPVMVNRKILETTSLPTTKVMGL
jgi:hypothetical protein